MARPTYHGGSTARFAPGARVWPFAAALLLGLLLAALDGIEEPAAFALATLAVAGFAALGLRDLGRLPQALPALVCVPVGSLLNVATDGASAGFAPLALIPLVWLALYGRPAELGLAIAGVALSLGAPLVLIGPPDYPDGEWTRVLLITVVGGLVGLAAQRLVGRITRGASTGAALTAAILESALDCVITMDHTGRVVEFNPAAARTFGYSAREAVGAELAELIVPPSLRDAHRRGLARCLATGQGTLLDTRLELTGMRSDRSEFPVELTITRIAGVEPPTFTGYIRDLTERRRAERAVAAQHGVARALAESATFDAAIPSLLRALGESMEWELGAAWLLDAEAGVMRCDTLWQQEGVAADEFRELTRNLTVTRGSGPVGRVWSTGEAASTESAPEEPNYPRAEAAAREGLRGGLWMPVRSGTEVLGVIEFYSREPNHLDAPLLETLSSVGTQIGEFLRRRQAEARLAHQALHDDLTGLPNRGLLIDRLRVALERSRRNGTLVAVLFMDVDDFKVINDSLGHHTGDDLLKELAARLDGSLRATDSLARPGAETVARFGGDEFVVLCEDITDAQAAIRIAERIGRDLGRPASLGGEEIAVTASLGIALGTAETATAESLVRDADAAMYSAKAQGRGQYELYDKAMRARLLARIAWESELHQALPRGELSLHYQPIVAAADGAVHGVEALLRWDHHERGSVSPAEFIPIAEASGLIVPIGEWVLAEACRQAVRWRDEHPRWPPLRMSVNLSPRQLADTELVANLRAILRDTRMDPAYLSLEITESVLVEEGEGSIAMLRSLKALGAQLNLDDFGTGYSSLSYLTRFPLDTLKLDRSFVSGLETNAEEIAIAAAIIEMARALGMTVIAEGVETIEQLDRLRSLGCPFAQGYLFARPMPVEAATAFLASSFEPRPVRGSGGTPVRLA